MQFSIIVPIYKVEQYLPECINSVLMQDFADFELILVDDGSPDRCGEICDEYAKNDARIRVIHKENRGVSDTRNTGLREAEGEYVFYLDGDDLMYPNALSKLCYYIKKFKSPELVIGNVIHYDGNKEWTVVDNSAYIDKGVKSIYDQCELFAKNFVQLPWRPYQNICKREFLINNSLFFAENYSCAEDCEWFMRMLPALNSFVLTDIKLVKYRVARSGSAITTPTFKSIIDQLDVFRLGFYTAEQYSNPSLMRQYFAERYTNIIMLTGLFKDSNQKQICYEKIRNNKEIIKSTKRKKYIAARLVWSVFGYSFGTKVLCFINRRIKRV